MDVDMIMQQYGVEELEQELRLMFPERNISFENLLGHMMKGDIYGACREAFSGITEYLFMELSGIKGVFVLMVILGLVSAFISHFSDIFERKQVSDMGFYFTYLFMVTILVKSFRVMADTTVDALQNIVGFMKLLIPTYLLGVGVVHGAMTAGVSCQLFLFVIYGVEVILSRGLMPMIYSYFMLVVVNGVWMEEKLSLLLELLRKGIKIVLKGAIGAVTGFSIFQTLITPVVDVARTTFLQKAVRAIPGIGNMTGSILELTIGSAMVIKNSIGVALLLMLLVLCTGPLIKIGLMVCMLKGAAALMGIVSDRRMVHCADRAGDAGGLLFRTAGSAVLLFVVAVAVITAAGGRV